jgi:V8-like Glu-specific endopeptidase
MHALYLESNEETEKNYSSTAENRSGYIPNTNLKRYRYVNVIDKDFNSGFTLTKNFVLLLWHCYLQEYDGLDMWIGMGRQYSSRGNLGCGRIPKFQRSMPPAAACTSEKSVSYHITTWHHNPKKTSTWNFTAVLTSTLNPYGVLCGALGNVHLEDREWDGDNMKTVLSVMDCEDSGWTKLASGSLWILILGP